MKQPRFESRRAFTLVELMAVMVIMSIVAGLLIAAAIGARKKADADAARAGVTYITAQIEAYYNKRGQLPPNLNESMDSFTTEAEIYQTLNEWNFPVPPEKQVDPWGNPFIIILDRDYGVNFPLQSGGTCYSTPPFNKMYAMYDPAPAAPDDPKEIHEGDPTTEPSYNDQRDGFQVISAGPDGRLGRNGANDYNADNFTNW